MSRKRLKDMLKKEMETRISSYSTSPAVNKEDDKPLLKGTDNVKNELLGKKKNDLPALDTNSEIKEIPIKEEQIVKKKNDTTELSTNKKVVKLKKKPKAESDKEDDGTYPKEEEQNTIKKVFIPKYVEKKSFKKTEYTEPDLDFID
jgi:hypothetical protein